MNPPSPARTAGRSEPEPILELGCAENLRRDEAMLRGGGPGARVAVLADRAISIGVTVLDSSAVVRRARAAGWSILRRGSGGTAVLHAPGDLAWSIVLPRSDPRVGRDYARHYDRLGAAVRRCLAEEGVATEWGPPPDRSAEYCLLGPRGSVLRADGRVLGGAAQHVSGTALLHHGILLRRVEVGPLRQIFDLGNRELNELTGLDALGVSASSLALGGRLARCLREDWTG